MNHYDEEFPENLAVTDIIMASLHSNQEELKKADFKIVVYLNQFIFLINTVLLLNLF